jgi:hypothetical protein
VIPRRRLELLEGSAAACAALAVPIAARLAARPLDRAGVVAFALAVVAGDGYLAADLVSGLVHWFCDRFDCLGAGLAALGVPPTTARD